MHVAKQVQTICNATKPSQWRYIDIANNPAGVTTRCMSPNNLMESRWLTGPEFLWSPLSHLKPFLEEIALEKTPKKKTVSKESSVPQLDPSRRSKWGTSRGRSPQKFHVRMSGEIKHPVPLSKGHHVWMLNIHHFHESTPTTKVVRSPTEPQVRSATGLSEVIK